MSARKILLAEDDADDQTLFCEFLSHRTDIVLLPVTENGLQLINALEQATNETFPDLVILDQNMPKSNGLQTLIMLKENSRFARIPVIIYSTYADEQLIKTCTAAGAALVVTKPVSKKGYEEMIDAVLKVVK